MDKMIFRILEQKPEMGCFFSHMKEIGTFTTYTTFDVLLLCKNPANHTIHHIHD